MNIFGQNLQCNIDDIENFSDTAYFLKLSIKEIKYCHK